MDAVFRALLPKRVSIPYILLLVGGALWVMSLTQVVFYTSHGVLMGYWVMVTGWMGFVLLQFAWYANLLVLLGLLLLPRYPNRAMTLVVIAVLVAGQAFWFDTIPGQQANMQIIALGTGFWCWYTAIVLLTLGVIFGSDAA